MLRTDHRTAQKFPVWQFFVKYAQKFSSFLVKYVVFFA